MKGLFTFILIVALLIVGYKIFVRINAPIDDKPTSSKTTVKRPSSKNTTTSADQNPIRQTRIGKKLDNIYDKHNSYTDDVLN